MAKNRTKRVKSILRVSSLDAVGTKFSFKFPTQLDTFQTKLGGLLSFLILLATIMISVVIGLTYFDTSSPNLVTSTQPVPFTPHSLYLGNIIPLISISIHGIKMQVNIDKFFTLKAYSVTYRYNEATRAPEIVSETEIGL